MSQNKTLPFRNQVKADLGALVPAEIREEVRTRAESKGRSISMVTTELLCVGMNINPARFGIPGYEAEDAAKSA